MLSKKSRFLKRSHISPDGLPDINVTVYVNELIRLFTIGS